MTDNNNKIGFARYYPSLTPTEHEAEQPGEEIDSSELLDYILTS